jgi:hypothetical protein
MGESKLANPGVVGLGGFGLTTMMLQFHNLGWCGLGPVVACALIFGGVAQLIAGFQEMKTGNSFGYSAFTAYGAFWIALTLIILSDHFGFLKSSTTDIGWFLVPWTLYTAIMWIGSMRVSSALAFTFMTLLIGFVLLVLAHFGYPFLTRIAGYELIITALSAWYVMAHIIFMDVFGKNILPVGKAWI